MAADQGEVLVLDALLIGLLVHLKYCEMGEWSLCENELAVQWLSALEYGECSKIVLRVTGLESL